MLRTLGLVLLVTLVAGCGDTEPRGTEAAAPASGSGDSTTILPATAADIVAAAQSPGAQVTLVNVWATWCAPCREEFPDLLRLEQTYRDRGLRLLLVSADFEDQLIEARRFLAAHGVRDTTYFKREQDMAFIDGLDPRWSGALPATLIYDSTGRLTSFWEGRADYAKFETAVLTAFGETMAAH
jgi:thiol-disulfide isomerase/thioredoxin